MTGVARIARGWFPVSAAVFVVDQITKQWAVSNLDNRDIDLLWTLRMHLSFNTGMAFGQAQSVGPIIGVVALVVIVVLLLSLRRQAGKAATASIGLIVGGAIGNLLDRLLRSPGLFRGAVVDFIDLQWFPIFNIADMCITIGGGILMLSSWRASKNQS